MPLQPPLRIGLFLAASLAASSACTPSLMGGSTEAECQPGQKVCVGADFQQCGDDGRFQTTSCGVASVCDDTLGCITCLPGSSTCSTDNTQVLSCNADGTRGAVSATCGFGETCRNGACVDSCEVAASEFVYLVDSDSNLLSFEPRRDTAADAVKVIGKLACASDGSRPYSMAVDRKARAWVLYTDGKIYFVSPKDASCTPSGYAPSQLGFQRFGMGFVSDSAGSRSEQIYLGNNLGNGSTKGLGKIDPASLKLTKLADFPATVTSSPEMTGTGAAELYGYFPSNTEAQHLIVRINKNSGAFDTTWQLPALPSGPQAWAFAHWGGRYYQFVTSGDKNQVRRYDPQAKTNTLVQDGIPYRIVGAGVSTCAPVVPG